MKNKMSKANEMYVGVVLKAMERYYKDSYKSIFAKTEMFPLVLIPLLFDVFSQSNVMFVKRSVKNENFLNLLLAYLECLKKVKEEFKNGLFKTPDEDYVLQSAVRSMYKSVPQNFDMVGFSNYFNALSEEEMKIQDNSLRFIGLSKRQLEQICHLMYWGIKPMELSTGMVKAKDVYLVCLKTFVELTLDTRSKKI